MASLMSTVYSNKFLLQVQTVMKLNTKLLILIVLFGIKASLHFVDGISGFFGGASYGDYGNAFVTGGIMMYIAYVIYSTRTKLTYWTAVLFVGLVLIRFVLGTGFLIFSETPFSLLLIVIAISNVLIFGIIPLLILLNKEVRDSFYRVLRQVNK